MAEVTGRIGNEEVELQNAATEATLRLLLQSSLSANKQSIDNITKMATKAGLDPVAVAAANANLKSVGETSKTTTGFFYKVGVGAGVVEEGFKKVDAAISPLVGALIDGTDKASVVFSQLSRIGGPLGLVATQFARLATFQEVNLKSYQSLTDAGVNFGGSLTNMRMAAQNSYMTMESFSKLMKDNSQTFAKMGGTVNDGAMAFTKLSNSLLKSEAGDSLRNLGYTTDQVNEGMASYIAMTGGRNKQELQNTDKITKGAAEYLTQLDALAEITGKSREEQEKALKEASANSAYEAMMQGLDEEGKKKATLAMQNALATGGKAGADLLKSQMLGLPPMTEAAQKLQALGPNVAAGIKQMGDAVKDTSKSMTDVEKGRAAAQVGASKDADRLGKGLLSAMSFMSGSDAEMAQSLQKTDNINKQQGIKTQEDAENQMKTVAARQKERQASEAASAVQTQKAVQELGQTVMSALLPVIRMLTPVMNAVVRSFGWIVEKLAEFKMVTIGLVTALSAYWLAQKYQNVMEKVKASTAAGGRGGAGGILDALKGAGALGTKGNPMFVTIVGGAAGGGVLDQILESEGKDGKGGGKGGAKGLKGLLKGAGKMAKGVAGIGALAGIASGVMDWNAISNDKSLSDAEKTKQKGGVVGEAGGGLAGGLAGAAAGAALGSVVPLIGTAIGGLIGGAIGAYGGGSLGKMGGEALAPKLADGAIVTKPTMVKAGEAGPEAIMPLSHLETLRTELQTLNKQTVEMLKYLKETAEYTRRTVDATKSLGGDMFKF